MKMMSSVGTDHEYYWTDWSNTFEVDSVKFLVNVISKSLLAFRDFYWNTPTYLY